MARPGYQETAPGTGRARRVPIPGMRTRKLFGLTIGALLLARSGWSCSCGPIGPACEELRKARMVFWER
jgi:hypothetical protein